MLTLGLSFPAFTQESGQAVIWPDGRKIAVSLSYDDALNSQLDNALPALDKHKFKASFYIVPNSDVINKRMQEWKALTENGHELGNHSVYHPCRASLPNREWVAAHHDLDKYTVAQMLEELNTANTFLKALDGKTQRTYTVPCGDTLIAGENYLNNASELFVAIKGQGVEKGFSVLWAPSDVSGEQLLEYLNNVPENVSLVNILFHGVGGDYLSVSTQAHVQLLDYLAQHQETYYVDSYINIMQYVAGQN
jgi:peptidoglycan/xylan/chitin deacetylase (PgdA/CDA1 family)